jgi:hypothetical protein
MKEKTVFSTQAKAEVIYPARPALQEIAVVPQRDRERR